MRFSPLERLTTADLVIVRNDTATLVRLVEFSSREVVREFGGQQVRRQAGMDVRANWKEICSGENGLSPWGRLGY